MAGIDLEAKVWTIPAARMKVGEQHRVPLSMTLAAVLNRLGVLATVHGTRSTFTDWTEEMTGFPREVKERALEHTVRDKVEAVYRPSNLSAKRRQLMDQWARFYRSAGEGGKVVEMRA